jgi:hypothetical protein
MPRLDRVHICDACGIGTRDADAVQVSREGLAVLNALLCRRCASAVEMAVEAAVREIETRRLEQALAARL